MIIWSRWGILVFPFIGIGIALGFGLKALLGFSESSGAVPGVFVGLGWIVSGALLLLLVRLLVGRHIDKPRPAVIWQKLAEPRRSPNGGMQTHEAVPVLHPQTGQQLVTRPVSTLFFVSIRFWPFVLAGGGLLVSVICLILVATGNG